MTVDVAAYWGDEEDPRWNTFRIERKVLAVARTFTSSVRLLDALSVFRDDLRVQVLFTADASTPFCDGVEALLEQAGVRVIPWCDIENLDYDLAVTASENVEFERVNAPIVVLPHGIGFQKYVPVSGGSGNRVSGVVPDRHLREKQVWMVTSHQDQEELLSATHPEAAARCTVAGDVTFDRISASLRLRDHYRRRLALRRGQRLIVLTSTWRPESLLGADPKLPGRILAALPSDDYRVALVTHPNIVSRHGERHLRQGLAAAFDAGMVRIPPDTGWEAALIAADLVIGDHGSVTLYGAAAGRPVLLGSPLADETVPRTVAAEWGGAQGRLNARLPLREQIERAIAAHRPADATELAGRLFAQQGRAMETLRSLMYRRLALTPPEQPTALRAVADPRPEVREPVSFVVHSWHEADGAIRVERFPAAVRASEAPVPGRMRHLSVGEEEPDLSLAQNASVNVRRTPAARDEAMSWITETLARWPGSHFAAAALENGCLVGSADGTWVEVVERSAGQADIALHATAVYTRLRTGALCTGAVRLRVGNMETSLMLEVNRPH